MVAYTRTYVQAQVLFRTGATHFHYFLLRGLRVEARRAAAGLSGSRETKEGALA